MTLHGESTVIGVRKYWAETKALTGGTIGSTGITGLSGLTADALRGGKMVVLDGNQGGEIYSIVSNTTTAIVLNRPDLLESGNEVVNSTDRVGLHAYKGISAESPEWMLVDSFDGPVPDIDWEELHAHRSGGLPYRLDSFQKKNNMDSSVEITIQNGTMLPLIFGKTVDTGTAEGGGGASTLANAIYPGETLINVVSGTNFTTNDYIRIDTATEGEIRKITNVTTNAITIDKPIRRTHANGVTVTEMDEALVFTHTFSQFYDEIYRNQPFIITQVYNGNSVVNNLTLNYFLQAKGWTFRNDGDKLKLSIPIIGYNFTYAFGSAAPSISSVTGKTAIFANSEISVNGVVDGKITTVETTADYGAEGRWYHNSDSDFYAGEVVFKRSTQNTNLGVRIESSKFLDLLLGGSKFDGYATYNFPTAGHSLTLNYKQNRPKSIPHPLPPGGPIEATFSLMPQYNTAVLVDLEPYY